MSADTFRAARAAAISSAKSQSDDAARLDGVQVLRAVAALAVLLMHVHGELEARFGIAQSVHWTVVGAAGVDLFFVISGFVMVYASGRLAGLPSASTSFILHRIARIVPLYWAMTAILVLYFLLIHRDELLSTSQLLNSFFFLPIDGIYPIHPLGWTLNYEMFFYAIFAVALLFPLRIAVFGMTALFAAAVVAALAAALPQPLAFWCQPIILEFCFGMLIAIAFRANVRIPRAFAAVLVAVALAIYAWSATDARSVDWRALAWGVPGAALVAAATLTASATGESRSALLRSFVLLGDASYSIYLVHLIVFTVLRRAFAGLSDLPGWAWLYALALIVVTLATALATYHLFERPVTRALYRQIARLGFTPRGRARQGD